MNILVEAPEGLRSEHEIDSVRTELTSKSLTYRAIEADPFSVLPPADDDLPF
ncbi:hypothetical protein [Krasilnikovia sp. MM14-A1259]|uniref:hypothetical protein n=1 Tax=Krasilnikovia sp. MM14-A1259 TaxID=3373539 RepID=UPI0038195F5F